MATDPIQINNNADRQLMGGNAPVQKLHKVDNDILQTIATNTSAGTPSTVTTSNSFNADVTLNKITGVRTFSFGCNDSLTLAKTAANPKFIWDIPAIDKTDLPNTGTKLYVSSTDNVNDTSQFILVNGIEITDVGGTNYLKEVLGYAVTNGQTQVEVKNLLTTGDVLFFRVNTVVNTSTEFLNNQGLPTPVSLPFKGLLGGLYVGELDGAIVSGKPADNLIQSVIPLNTFFSPALSSDVSQIGSFTVPQMLIDGSLVIGVIVDLNAFVPDDAFKFNVKLISYNGSGDIIDEKNLISAQSGTKGLSIVETKDLFIISAGQEAQYRVKMESNNQKFGFQFFGKLYFTPP